MIYLGVFDNISGDTISVVICTSGNTWKYQGFYAYDDYLTYGSDLEVWEQDPEAYDTGVQHFALTMAETPVTITCNGSNTDIYAPINALSASISILLPTPQLDIYNSDLSTEVMVRNETTDTILFYGYVTPNIYSQDYNDALDYVTLECISPISALEHCKMSASVPRVMNIYEIVKYALEATDYYKEFYVSNTLAINDSTLTRFGVFERLYLYTPNFFDDEGGESWTLKEILKRGM